MGDNSSSFTGRRQIQQQFLTIPDQLALNKLKKAPTTRLKPILEQNVFRAPINVPLKNKPRTVDDHVPPERIAKGAGGNLVKRNVPVSTYSVLDEAPAQRLLSRSREVLSTKMQSLEISQTAHGADLRQPRSIATEISPRPKIANTELEISGSEINLMKAEIVKLTNIIEEKTNSIDDLSKQLGSEKTKVLGLQTALSAKNDQETEQESFKAAMEQNNRIILEKEKVLTALTVQSSTDQSEIQRLTILLEKLYEENQRIREENTRLKSELDYEKGKVALQRSYLLSRGHQEQ